MRGRTQPRMGGAGCGMADFAAAVGDRHTVHGFDHVAVDETVTACDMASVPLDDRTLDVAVFFLSLMGSNLTDYLREAWRVLKLDGILHIWEAASRFDDPERFAADLERELGFRVLDVENRAQFSCIRAMKTRRAPKGDAALRLRAGGVVEEVEETPTIETDSGDPADVIVEAVQKHGSLTTKFVAEVLGKSPAAARKMLKALVAEGRLAVVGKGRGTQCVTREGEL